ncbi:hypothetical protein V6N13_129274 [Hibiscus sabdariffa]
MSVEVPLATLSSPIQNPQLPETTRRSADFHPSIWGEKFLSYANNIMDDDDSAKKEEHEELKNEVKKLLLAKDSRSITKKIYLVRTIEEDISPNAGMKIGLGTVLHVAGTQICVGAKTAAVASIYTNTLVIAVKQRQLKREKNEQERSAVGM